MKTITGTSYPFGKILYPEIKNIIAGIDKWVQRQEPTWEYNRLGIAATGIFVQVTIAGAMIAFLGLAGGSLWVGSVGMLCAFLANSLAFGQVRMRLLLGSFLLSIIINAAIAIYYGLQLL
jgi:hypothetical protein